MPHPERGQRTRSGQRRRQMDFRKPVRCAQKQNRRASGVTQNGIAMNLQEIKRIVDKFDPNNFALGFNYSTTDSQTLLISSDWLKAFERIPMCAANK